MLMRAIIAAGTHVVMRARECERACVPVLAAREQEVHISPLPDYREAPGTSTSPSKHLRAGFATVY